MVGYTEIAELAEAALERLLALPRFNGKDLQNGKLYKMAMEGDGGKTKGANVKKDTVKKRKRKR